MKAILWTRYGPPEVLQLGEVEKPHPGDHEVLVKIRATTVTAGDCEMRSLRFPPYLRFPLRLYNGFSKPKRSTILGQEFSGEIESAGNGVTLFQAGDPVFGATDVSMGAYAEYICLPEDPRDALLARKPSNMSFEEAASVPTGGLEALHFLRKGKVGQGQQVLINGAGGSIGTFAVQLARHFGAEVTAVDKAGKLEMLQRLGAHHVIDYMKEDFTRGGHRYDVIFDIAGTSPYSRSLGSLRRKGSYLIANPRLWHLFRSPWTSLTSGKRVISWTSSRKREDLLFLKELVEAGKLKTVIDRSYPLEQVADAHKYVETGQKAGNVIITVKG